MKATAATKRGEAFAILIGAGMAKRDAERALRLGRCDEARCAGVPFVCAWCEAREILALRETHETWKRNHREHWTSWAYSE